MLTPFLPWMGTLRCQLEVLSSSGEPPWPSKEVRDLRSERREPRELQAVLTFTRVLWDTYYTHTNKYMYKRIKEFL